MAINKNAFIRYQVLDRCFRNTGRMYFWEDLLDECNNALAEESEYSDGIRRRQLFDDIRFMQSEQGWSVPLEKLRYGRRVFYRYEDPSFSINNQPLNDTEVEKIKSALQIFSRFAGTPQFEWVNEIIPLLETKLGLISKKQEVIGFESNVDLHGLHFISPLFNAIINERVLLITYKDFKTQTPYQITFHPYYLKQYNNRWFVFGFNPAYQHPQWNMALDRIQSIQETPLPYEPSSTDWEEYFYDIIGVTLPKDVELQKIVLEFNSVVAPYVITKPLHPSQKYKTLQSGIEVTIKVIPNIELERLILSFGEHAKVSAPKDFAAHMAQRARALGNLYQV